MNVGFWKGRRIIGLFQVVLLGTLVAELWMVIKMAGAVTSLEESRDSLRDNEEDELTYDNLEKNVATRFNDFYFGAVDGCYGVYYLSFLCTLCSSSGLITSLPNADAKYEWFWTWVGKHCVDGLSAERCRSCGDFSATTCLADLSTCYASDDDAGPTCPYQICREATLTFIIRSFKYVLRMFAFCDMILR